MYRKLVFPLIVFLALSGCQPHQAEIFTPTEPESTSIISESTETKPAVKPPEILEATETPLLSQTPTDTPTPLFTSSPLPEIPTLFVPTSQATSIQQPEANSAAIQFYTPGHLSKVTSPVVFYGYAIPGSGRKGRIELFGEDGALLAEELIQLNTDYKWAFFYWHLDFTPRGAGELGRLSLSTQDQYNRLIAVQSVHLILMPGGLEIINPPGELTEPCSITNPLVGQRSSGGKVAVSGIMRPFNELPLIIELISTDGASLGVQLAPVPSGSAGLNIPFAVELQYSITKATSALLRVSQPDDRIGGIMYLYSQEIFLNP